MKRIIIITVLFVFFSNSFFSQEKNGIEQFIPSQAPDAAAFSKANFLPISEYTGKPNISIPLYEIKLGTLSIPISISYNYGGIKVDEKASSVGLGWNLNAGGSVVRQVNGLHDLKLPETQSAYGVQGYLSDESGQDCAQYINRDGEPDYFFASAPGLNTKFIGEQHFGNTMNLNEYKLNGIDLNKQGNEIKMKMWWYNTAMQLPSTTPSFLDGIIDYWPGLIGTKITNTQGFEYTFEDYSLNLSISQVTSWDIGTSPVQPIITDRFVDAQKLSNIFDPITNSSVYFDYNLPNDQHESTRIKGVFRPNGLLGSKNWQKNIHKIRKLKKIRFDEGEIEFFYEFTRLDMPAYSNNIALDNKALSKIVVKDLHGNIVKDIRFVYTNVASLENCTDPECYRLVLDEVYFKGNDGIQNIPGYKFDYNTTKLPKRNSWISDFLGYHNGEVASPAPTVLGHYIPKTYHYPNSGKYSFLPFNIGNSNYTQLNGNFSLEANVNYTKAALLEKITYPTGGYTLLESESNNFKILGQTVQGGGLRIKKQKMYDFDNSLQREITYEYKKENGETSGSIINLPRFNDYIIKGANFGFNGLRIYQTQLANLKLTESSFVGYSRVKVYETGNGYTIKNFTSPKDYPNIDATITMPSNPNPSAVLRVNNGTFPDMMTDADTFRGKLKEEVVFNQNGDSIAKVVNTFRYKKFQTIPIGNAVINFDQINDDEGCTDAPHYMSESAFLYVERNLTKTTKSISYNADGSKVSTTISYAYEDNYPFVKEKDVEHSKEGTYKTVFNYPFSNPEFNIQYSGGIKPLPLPCEGEEDIRIPLSKLTDNNIISTPFYTLEYKDRNLVSNKLLIYKEYQYTSKAGVPPLDVANGIPILEKSISSTSRILTNNANQNKYDCLVNKDMTDYEIHLYDNFGNPVEISSSSLSDRTVLIWGYQGKQLIARIKNAKFSDVSGTVLLDIIAKSNTDNDRTIGNSGNEGLLRTVLQKLRNPSYFPNLVDSQITTYTYDPLIGLTSKTDARGETVYYFYDEFNRLINVKDNEGHILSKNQYNYKN